MSGTSRLPIRILLLDPYALIRAALRLLLEKQPGFKVVGEAGDSAEGLKLAAEQKPDLILLKLNPAGDPGLDVIAQLLKAHNCGRIILMITEDDRQICIQAIQEGVLGIVSKRHSPETLVKAIQKVHAGEIWIERSMVARLLTTTDIIRRSQIADPEAKLIQQLSYREREVIQLICRGLKNQQIASQLCISESTVRHHLTSIYNKVGVSDRLELLVFANRKGLAKKPE